MILINNKIINFNAKKKNVLYYDSIYEIFLSCSILGLIFFAGLGIYFVQNECNIIIINSAWAVEYINGTDNADNITGTIHKDIIKGFNGNDILIGKEVGDDISGGSGDDWIYGNEGRDVLWGKAGNDQVEGGEGNDRIYGGRGNDVLVGGPGKDTITGGLGKDVFICGTGTDIIRDFNTTQKDTQPQGDCEKLKYDDTEYFVSLQQKQEKEQQNNFISENKNHQEKIEKIDTKNDDKNSDKGFFFGLFK
ncbi:MAG: calcium-binding protein [Nitrososphaeraceae archaeon]